MTLRKGALGLEVNKGVGEGSMFVRDDGVNEH